MYECDVVDFGTIFHEFDIIFFSDKNSSSSNYYLNIRAKFKLPEKAIIQILSHSFHKKITENLNKMNKAIEIEKQRAEAWLDLIEKYGVSRDYKNIFKEQQNKNDDV